jgi:hypothetical protein
LTIYPASEAIARGNLADEATIKGVPHVSAMLAELSSMLRPARREFLTFTARKSP